MTGDGHRDQAARLAELEATVRGLTQELVSCEERIRELEAAVEAATKDSPGEAEAASEAGSEGSADEAGGDLEDIIVA